MGYVSRVISRVGGRRVVLALGGVYVAFAAGFPATSAAGDRTAGGLLVVSVLVGASGLVLLYGGYRLPRTNVRPDLHDVVASWCVRAVGTILGVVLLAVLIDSVDDPVEGFVVLPALASVAGLGMGYHDARARTRALDAEERQREAERYSRELERYQIIVETVNDGIFVTDEDHRFTLVNEAYVDLVGYDREELIGSHTSLVVDDEEDVAAWDEKIQRNLSEGTAHTKTYETTLKTASGERIDVEWTVAPLPEQEAGDHDRAVVVRDVTERNERERQLAEQNERLDSFAGMLAHELRNPVTIGQIYSQQLSSEANPEAVDYVTDAFDRIENTIDIMLVITRGSEAISGRSLVQLGDVARAAWAEVETPEATLEMTIDRTMVADETYLRHLFRNLFENAVQHGGSDVTVTVGDLPTGFYVADDGTGIPADDRDAVFEAGYTTAAEQGGTGLGLVFVKELAEVYEWACAATESATGGARFEFTNVDRDSLRD